MTILSLALRVHVVINSRHYDREKKTECIADGSMDTSLSQEGNIWVHCPVLEIRYQLDIVQYLKISLFLS